MQPVGARVAVRSDILGIELWLPSGNLDGSDFPQANADSTVLWIDVSRDIGRGDIYFNPIANGGKQFTAESNLSRACTTLVVRQRDLARRDSSQSWQQYQQVSLPFDAMLCNDSTAGPLDPRSTSRRLNLRVRYAGNATVALRSVALRDKVGNDVPSELPAGIERRDAQVLHAERSMLSASSEAYS